MPRCPSLKENIIVTNSPILYARPLLPHQVILKNCLIDYIIFNKKKKIVNFLRNLYLATVPPEDRWWT